MQILYIYIIHFISNLYIWALNLVTSMYELDFLTEEHKWKTERPITNFSSVNKRAFTYNFRFITCVKFWNETRDRKSTFTCFPLIKRKENRNIYHRLGSVIWYPIVNSKEFVEFKIKKAVDQCIISGSTERKGNTLLHIFLNTSYSHFRKSFTGAKILWSLKRKRLVINFISSFPKMYINFLWLLVFYIRTKWFWSLIILDKNVWQFLIISAYSL